MANEFGLFKFLCVGLLLIIAQLNSCHGNDDFVPFTLLADAIPKRAVCIDGTPSGYHHALGFGGGVNNWIVYLMCLFPECLVPYIQTPLFLLNSAFDMFQIQNNLKPNNSGDLKGWENCTKNLCECTHTQRELIQDFGNAFVETLMNIGDNPSRGVFINAYYAHAFTEYNELWNSNLSPTLANKTISQAVGDWFFDRSSIKLIDNRTFPFINCPLK